MTSMFGAEQPDEQIDQPEPRRDWQAMLRAGAELGQTLVMVVQEVKPVIRSVLWQLGGLCVGCGAELESERARVRERSQARARMQEEADG